VNVCRWVPSGKRIITGNSKGEFTLWNGSAFNFETILQAHDVGVRAMTWSHSGNFLISGDDSGTIKYWESTMTNLQALSAHGGMPVRALSFSPSDSKFVSCSEDATVRLWDWERLIEERTLSGHGWDVKDVAWHPFKAVIASGSKDSVVKLWDAKTGVSLATLLGHKNHVNRLAWNSNGHWLISGSKDEMLKLYDIRMMREVCTLKGHGSVVTSLTWHPFHERLLVSGGQDGTIIYWIIGLDQPQEIFSGAHDSAVWDMDWHPAGHVLATGSNDFSTKFWCRSRPGDTLNLVTDLNKVDAKDTPESRSAEVSIGQKRRLPSEDTSIKSSIPGIEARVTQNQTELMPLPAAVAPFASQKPVIDRLRRHEGERAPFHRGFSGRFNPQFQPRRSNSWPAPDTYTCVKCGNKGHWVQDCPAQQGTIPPPDYMCYGCNAKGKHWKAECPNQLYRGYEPTPFRGGRYPRGRRGGDSYYSRGVGAHKLSNV